MNISFDATIVVISVLAVAFVSLSVFNNNAYAQNTTVQNVSSSNSTLYVMGNAQEK